MDIVIITLLAILIILTSILLFRSTSKRASYNIEQYFRILENSILRQQTSLDRIEKELHNEFERNRAETNNISRINREELKTSILGFEDTFNKQIKHQNEYLGQKFHEFLKQQSEINTYTTGYIKDLRNTIDSHLRSIREDNSRQLQEMRKTVDEKLQKTLHDRLNQSFETVSKQLISVREGLGEMKNLATDVGSLKKVLGNVKLRGGIGEVQLSMLLEQILAPEQYDTNVKTKTGTTDQVEFAIRLPGKDESGSIVWLPIDAKFPKEVYEHLLEAYDDGDPVKINIAQKQLDGTIKKMARDIREKYIDPPNTTDFGIMFLPFEGIYAEVVRKAALLEELQGKYQIIITGPSTIAALLNSLQMGFKTLAIRKKSSEVWQILGLVKKEFENFGGLLEKAQKNIQTGLNQLDDVMGKRTRAIQRKLKNIEVIKEDKNKYISTHADYSDDELDI